MLQQLEEAGNTYVYQAEECFLGFLRFLGLFRNLIMLLVLFSQISTLYTFSPRNPRKLKFLYATCPWAGGDFRACAAPRAAAAGGAACRGEVHIGLCQDTGQLMAVKSITVRGGALSAVSQVQFQHA